MLCILSHGMHGNVMHAGTSAQLNVEQLATIVPPPMVAFVVAIITAVSPCILYLCKYVIISFV